MLYVQSVKIRAMYFNADDNDNDDDDDDDSCNVYGSCININSLI